MNLGQYANNFFDESTSTKLAARIIEKGRKCKTHFLEMDKTPNFDGRISILQGTFERLIVEVQIKSLPKNIKVKDGKFKYPCDTKIFNCFTEHITFNPVALLAVDIKREKLFFKILTKEYINDLAIGNQKTKTISFSEEDIYSDDMFINKAFKVAKITVSNVKCYVDCCKIRSMIKNIRKNDKQERQLVYKRGSIRGYMTAFRVKSEGKHYIPFSQVDMECGNELDHAVIQFEKGYVRVTRLPSDSINISDADFGNIVLEIAKEVYQNSKKPVLYFNYGPVYWFEGNLMWQMKSEQIELDWIMRL